MLNRYTLRIKFAIDYFRRLLSVYLCKRPILAQSCLTAQYLYKHLMIEQRVKSVIRSKFEKKISLSDNQSMTKGESELTGESS